MLSSMSKEMRVIQVVEYDFFEAIKNQYFYKLNAYHSMFGTMIIMQMVAMGFTFLGQTVGVGSNNLFVTVNVFSANIIISFSLIWAFMMAIILTNKASKNMMATFVTDKRTNHLSNIFFMITLSVIGGVTSFLLGFFIKMIVYIMYHAEKHIYFESMTIGELFIGILATILYLLLFFAIGYLIGEVVQVNKIFVFLIPVFIIGMIVIFGYMFEPIVTFYTFETNLFIFLCKVIFTVAVLFSIASLVGSRLEVRRA